MQAPTSKELEELKKMISGGNFDLDKLKMIVNKARQGVEPDMTDDARRTR